MQDGRLNPDAKQNALKVENDIFPCMCALIIGFIREMYRSPVSDYVEQWNNKTIKIRTTEVLELIQSLEHQVVETVTTE